MLLQKSDSLKRLLVDLGLAENAVQDITSLYYNPMLFGAIFIIQT